jgi:hypothetical protein
MTADHVADHARRTVAAPVTFSASLIRRAIAQDQLRTCHPYHARRRALHTVAAQFWHLCAWLARP